MTARKSLVALTFAFVGLSASTAWATHTVSDLCFDQTVQIKGTDGVDNPLNGNDNANVIAAGAGSDSIYGFDGADRICGDADNDYIEGDHGNDYLTGNDGGDVVKGGVGGDNEVRGSIGGHLEADAVYGGPGDDKSVRGGPGDDHVEGGDGDDVVRDGQGADFASGGAGNDAWIHSVESGVTDSDDDTFEAIFSGAGPSYC